MTPLKGFREDHQFRTEKEEQNAARDLMEYKKGDPVWRKKVFDEKGYPMVFMQLMKPGYACNPQEFIEQKAFVSSNIFLILQHRP